MESGMIRDVKIQATKDKTYTTILLKQCENEKADRNKHINLTPNLLTFQNSIAPIKCSLK